MNSYQFVAPVTFGGITFVVLKVASVPNAFLWALGVGAAVYFIAQKSPAI
jgi:hypothetical protein